MRSAVTWRETRTTVRGRMKPSKAFLTVAAAVAACAAIAGATIRSRAASPAAVAATPRFAAVAFDYFVLFNPGSVTSAAERMFPGRGQALTDLWRTRQFEYGWLRSLEGRYTDFGKVTEDALAYAASATRIPLADSQRTELLDAYRHLAPWPETIETLARLRAAHVRVIALSNFSPSMLEANARHAGLTGLLEALISTDASRTYKPDPRAYQLGADYLRLDKSQIVFAAFGGWDAAGARSFGYPTVWVNRQGQPVEQLDAPPDRTVRDSSGLVDFVLGR